MYEANIDGTRRYMPWDGTPRTTIDGQWRVRKTVSESPLNYPGGLPYTHFVTMDTLVKRIDESAFDISGSYYNLWGVLRDPNTGSVDTTKTVVVPGYIDGQPYTYVFETKLWGTLLPDSMDLEFSWKWSIQETGEVNWLQHEHYEGVPRYKPHNHVVAEPPEGAYNAEYKMLTNDCNAKPYSERYMLDVWKLDDGKFWPKITNFGVEPTVQLGSNGTFTMAFNRYFNSTLYNYTVTDGSKISGNNVDINLTIDTTSAEGWHVCTKTYKISGAKRYRSYQ